MKYLRISRKLFSFCLFNHPLSCFVRKVSVKCSETVVMNLHIIGNTFVKIRIKSHTLHFHHSDWFPIVRDCLLYLYREQSEKYSAKWDRGFIDDLELWLCVLWSVRKASVTMVQNTFSSLMFDHGCLMKN